VPGLYSGRSTENRRGRAESRTVAADRPPRAAGRDRMNSRLDRAGVSARRPSTPRGGIRGDATWSSTPGAHRGRSGCIECGNGTGAERTSRRAERIAESSVASVRGERLRALGSAREKLARNVEPSVGIRCLLRYCRLLQSQECFSLVTIHALDGAVRLRSPSCTETGGTKQVGWDRGSARRWDEGACGFRSSSASGHRCRAWSQVPCVIACDCKSEGEV
jgi:hypothetical protein